MNQQERIDRYLSHQMSPDEIARFKAEIASNPALAEAVQFQQDLTKFFEEREPALEAKLADFGKEHFPVEKSNKTFPWWRWIIPILLVGLGIGAWWIQSDQDATHPLVKEAIPTIEKTAPIIDTTPDAPPTIFEKEPPNSSPQSPPNPPQEKPPVLKKSPPLIASLDPRDFQANPMIESLMAEQVRNSASTTSLENPAMDTILAYNQKILLKVEGFTTAPPPYELVIYTNRIFDFENDHRVLSQSLSGIQQDEKIRFSFNAETSFPKGLYYLLLLSEEGDEMLYISRFRVE